VNAALLILSAIVIFAIAYVFYGGYLAKKWGVDANRTTPANEFKDDIDYFPAKPAVLLGHHFASIAGAGPIVGPIVAAAFGWLPVFLWIIIGNIFFGSVHDFGSLYASIRHRGKTIGEVINKNIGSFGKKLFNIFVWLALVLVLAVFMIVIAKTFAAVPSAATASILFIILAIAFGVVVNRTSVNFVAATVVGVIVLAVCVFIGMKYPLQLSKNTWIYVLMVYMFIASVTPVWILLQPRDYLNSFLLYAVLLGAVLGIIISQPEINISAFTGFKTHLGYLFPVLFVVVACGAISGFHSIVASGTTAKQLNKETDAKLIGYGGMLIEGILAIVALITAAVLAKESLSELLEAGGPVKVFSTGVGNFMSSFGIPLEAGMSFTALAVSAFAMTTLDTATRLGRLVFQELFEPQGSEDNASNNFSIISNMYVATTITVVAAAGLTLSGQWSAIWPIFGSVNQLLAALSLLAVSVWLANAGKSNNATKIPMIFVFIVTIIALTQLIISNFAAGNVLLGILSCLLLLLALVLIYQAYKTMSGIKNSVLK